jgi:hypothetical protein
LARASVGLGAIVCAGQWQRLDRERADGRQRFDRQRPHERERADERIESFGRGRQFGK